MDGANLTALRVYTAYGIHLKSIPGTDTMMGVLYGGNCYYDLIGLSSGKIEMNENISENFFVKIFKVFNIFFINVCVVRNININNN